jgi:hypothetical protein
MPLLKYIHKLIISRKYGDASTGTPAPTPHVACISVSHALLGFPCPHHLDASPCLHHPLAHRDCMLPLYFPRACGDSLRPAPYRARGGPLTPAPVPAPYRPRTPASGCAPCDSSRPSKRMKHEKHLKHTKKTCCNIHLKQIKYLEQTCATSVWNICNIQIKHLQHASENG